MMTGNDTLTKTSTAPQGSHTPRNAGLLMTIVVVSAILIGAIIFGAAQMFGSDSTDGAATQNTTSSDTNDQGATSPTPMSSSVVPEDLGGQEAIDALTKSGSLERVAKQNNMTVDGLKGLLLNDETAYVSKRGMIIMQGDSSADVSG